ncbi:probable low-affinity inorganic phosphate transporter [Halarchaeum acidiphilum MH1-52-1]|uniref:Phosphate transporter n=2 Tax=Halarchaeum acidiphilum TaxID=489138 RepID=U3A938_9EURY|nr:inorganic phosphate transporter [Halarchaeum acidiphilum]GAD51273.1 probable low-affinity inorganic phosphate transporter [Halarchaeum acidiphilum MH1-52-1]
MVTVAAAATLLVAALASMFMAWTIGAGSSGSTPFAPAVGANAIPVMRAGFYVGLLGFLGAVLQGANVSQAVGRGLVAGATLSSVAVIVALLTAATLVAIGVFTGYPIATAFTVTGAVVGTGLAMGGAPAWDKYTQIATLWVLVPFVGGFASFATAYGLREIDRDALLVPALAAVVGALVANVKFVLLGPPGIGQSIAATVATALPDLPHALAVGGATVALALAVAAVVRWDVVEHGEAGNRHFLLALGGLVAFSAGGSQVGLAVGPLLPLVGDSVPTTYVLVGGGLGLLVGSWTGAPRMIKALAQDYSSLGPRRSIAALIPSFAIAQAAVFFGVPVSFNEIIVSAIVGGGYAAGSAGGGVSREKMVKTVAAWAGSLAIAFGASYAVFSAVERLA